MKGDHQGGKISRTDGGKLLDGKDDENVTRSVLLNSRNGPFRIRKLASIKWTGTF